MQVHQTPTILLTRPRAASEQFAAGLDGVHVVIAPLMEIVTTGTSISLQNVKGVIFTSQNAVAFAPSADFPAYCVGPNTARAARAAGFPVRVVKPDADALVRALIDDPPDVPLVHLHGVHVRGDVAARLTAAGVLTQGIAIYDQCSRPPDAAFHTALAQAPLIVPLFSPRSASLFAHAAPHITEDTQIIALSQAVADALPPAWAAQTHVVASPNGAEMSNAIQRFSSGRNSP